MIRFTRARKLTLLFVFLGLFIAASIMILIFSYDENPFQNFFDLIISWSANFGAGVIGLILSGYVLGEKIDYFINVKRRDANKTGIFFSYLILLLGSISGCTVGFIEEGIDFGLIKGINSYYLAPMSWIFIIGFIPTGILGYLLGHMIKE